MNLAYPRRRTRGFSLVETLVALVVICVGLLGIAKMQALALSNMTTSRLRALAAFEAAGLAAAMHSNRDYWANDTPAAFTVTVNPSAGPAVTSPSDATLAAVASADYAAGNAANGATGLNACVGSVGGGAMCAFAASPQALAAYDLARWTSSLATLLPNPTATISCPNPPNSPANCTIQITWTEQAVSINQQQVQAQAAGTCANLAAAGQQCFELPSYVLYVEP